MMKNQLLFFYLYILFILLILTNCQSTMQDKFNPQPCDIPVSFPEFKLEKEVRLTLNKYQGEICLNEIKSLKFMICVAKDIEDTSGIEYMTSLTYLDLSFNDITDISNLAKLVELSYLRLNVNQISEISFLSSIKKLETLGLSFNHIKNIDALSGLTSLHEIDLSKNYITDLSPLILNQGIGEGDNIDLTENPLNEISINEQIAILESRGVVVKY